MTREFVSVKGLNVSYSGNAPVLENVFFTAKKGEFTSIVGKSGVGKTTLFNSICGLNNYDGEIKRPEKIALVFQNYSLYPWMTVEENIAFGLGNKSENKIMEIAEKTGLAGMENRYPKQLSGGQQQRVAIARAMASKPDLLLLDEPFANLDSFTRLKMQEWLNELAHENKTTTILVTHDVDEALLLSDRVIVLKDKTLQNEFIVPFVKPRRNEIRYEPEFQELKKGIIKSI